MAEYESESAVKFVPKQAIPLALELYEEFIGDSMEKLVTASLDFILPIHDGIGILDAGCGTGAASAAVAAVIRNQSLNNLITTTGIIDDNAIRNHSPSHFIVAIDKDDVALNAYRRRAAREGWQAHAINMDVNALKYDDGTFHLALGNILLSDLPNDGIDAVQEVHRTLVRGGTAIFNSWKYTPFREAIHTAAKETRPEGIPLPCADLGKWSNADFLRSIVEKGGFA
ncbi:S-adenosyl-L-methionine-dependent methyltransferase [Xylariaceae sp. FL0016]|nr:S-adenosyl-L-methionine-dependent methyltransferase [Xylariaceae sp. FL0016]